MVAHPTPLVNEIIPIRELVEENSPSSLVLLRGWYLAVPFDRSLSGSFCTVTDVDGA